MGELSPEELEGQRRQKASEIDSKETILREYRVAQRLRLMWLLASLVVTLLLGGAMMVGVWRHERGPVSVLGTAAAAFSTLLAGYFIIEARPRIARERFQLQELNQEQVGLAAAAATDASIALRIYWVSSKRDVEAYRRKARLSRRASNLIQWTIIIGSATATSLTAISAGSKTSSVGYRVGAAAVSLLVTIGASAGGFFKFRDRSFNEQQAADAIDKEIKASELRIGDYASLADQELEALQLFAQRVEDIKEEQRKRELQLEQSTDSKESQSS